MSTKPTDALVPIPKDELANVAGATSSATSDQLNLVLTQIQSSLKDLSNNNNNGGFSTTDMMLLMMVMLNSGGGGGGYVVGGGGFGGGFGINRTRIYVNAAGGGYPYGLVPGGGCCGCCGW